MDCRSTVLKDIRKKMHAQECATVVKNATRWQNERGFDFFDCIASSDVHDVFFCVYILSGKICDSIVFKMFHKLFHYSENRIKNSRIDLKCHLMITK